MRSCRTRSLKSAEVIVRLPIPDDRAGATAAVAGIGQQKPNVGYPPCLAKASPLSDESSRFAPLG